MLKFFILYNTYSEGLHKSFVDDDVIIYHKSLVLRCIHCFLLHCPPLLFACAVDCQVNMLMKYLRNYFLLCVCTYGMVIWFIHMSRCWT